MLAMKFVGAIQGVTRSCSRFWHTESGTQFAVDCGIHQGPHHIEWLNRNVFSFSPSEIQYVLLTHAHIDHCGLIPKLVSEGFRGWVHCTQATKEVAIELLTGAANIKFAERTFRIKPSLGKSNYAFAGAKGWLHTTTMILVTTVFPSNNLTSYPLAERTLANG